MEWITLHQSELIQLGTALVTVASIIANFIDPNHENKSIAAIGKLIQTLALNLTSKNSPK
jgi:hypothetical protein